MSFRDARCAREGLTFFKTAAFGLATTWVRVAGALSNGTSAELPSFILARERKENPAMLQTAAKHISVLAVDDSLTFLGTLTAFLEADACVGRVATASSGEEALCAVEVLHPDLVLMDLQMPGRSGLETSAELHEKYPEIPIIIITAHQLPGLREFCTRSGALGMIRKSEIMDELPRLLRTIRNSLSGPVRE